MKILHVSDGGLPDPRVERMAMTMRKQGHEMVFIGGHRIGGQHLSAFSSAVTIPLGIGPSIVHDPRVKKRWIKAIKDVDPDIVHAHNVVVGHFLLETNYPVVFDDHENLSAQKFIFMARPFLRKTAARFLVRKFPDWEQQMAEKYPVLTVSEGISNYYRKFTTNIGVVINVPFLSEVEWIENPATRSGLVYMGGDFSWPRFIPTRDMTGLRDILEFDVVAGLPHKEMMSKLSTYKIGLTPYKLHPFHLISNPNKNYEYLHAGLQVVLNENFTHLFEGNPYIHQFKSYDDIRDVVDSVPSVDGMKIMEFAREHYIWDHYEHIVHEAYEKAL
ncbi:MAG: glycosyltransferase [Candidatus Thorarchaeota archaeon]|nr:glycosyltransferase [Candidatus Thorarchaeota archaeon]